VDIPYQDVEAFRVLLVERVLTQVQCIAERVVAPEATTDEATQSSSVSTTTWTSRPATEEDAGRILAIEHNGRKYHFALTSGSTFLLINFVFVFASFRLPF
jgi:tetrahydromethanopterin S-methyltransferase subunit B